MASHRPHGGLAAAPLASVKGRDDVRTRAKILASKWKREEMAHSNVLYDPHWSLDADWSRQDQHHHFNLERLGALEDIHDMDQSRTKPSAPEKRPHHHQKKTLE
jgi:hypothetical protein